MKRLLNQIRKTIGFLQGLRYAERWDDAFMDGYEAGKEDLAMTWRNGYDDGFDAGWNAGFDRGVHVGIQHMSTVMNKVLDEIEEEYPKTEEIINEGT